MKSPVVKRSIVIAGHKTSVSLEDAFWQGLKHIATGRNMTLSDLVAAIDSDRRQGNLSSAESNADCTAPLASKSPLNESSSRLIPPHSSQVSPAAGRYHRGIGPNS